MNSKTYEVYDKLNPPVEEAFKVLRTNIQFCSPEKRIKSLTVVSSNPREGKTSISINLAISIARSGTKVLLVDADLRKPMLIKRLGGKDFIGLSTFLNGDASLAEIICNTSIENLSYISCGPKPHNPSELIGSAVFATFIKTLEEIYDMVIIDTSTLGSVIDSAIIASQTDGTVIVIASRTVPVEKAKRLKEQLENANASILGVVLNKVNKRDYKAYKSDFNNFYYFNNFGDTGKYEKGKFKKLKKNEVTYHD